MNFETFGIEELSSSHELNQVLFINQAGDTTLDDFFNREYEKVVSLFHEYGCDFYYLPKVISSGLLREVIAYNRPDLSEQEMQNFERNFSVSKFYSLFKSSRTNNRFVGLCSAQCLDMNEMLLHYNYEDSLNVLAFTQYIFANLQPGSDDEIWSQLDYYFKKRYPYRYDEIHGKILSYSACSCIIVDELLDNYDSDENFPKDAFELTQEIKANIEKLRAMGVNELLIRGLFIQSIKLSKLRITNDFRLILTDYQNKEIKFGPLPKALYLLFLRHPEGIIFKRISEYRDELLALYVLVSGNELDSDMRATIMQITDPCCNSLNENCSRIRQAFIKEIDEKVVENYYVTGQRATPKGIRLNRELVCYDEEVATALAKI